MKVRFWGTRGSIPKPGPNTLRYGGNTACVEVRTDSGALVIIDCGTGAHALGQSLMAEARTPIRGSLLISHTHWDHIQGFPFFAPLFVPGNQWDIYAPHGLSQSLRDTLAAQMQYAYFPVTLESLGADIRYHDLVEGSFEIDGIQVTTQYLNHPAITLGYRLQADGVAVVYACDHECIAQKPVPGRNELEGREKQHVEFLRDADLVLHDAQYTALEYPEKIGWGHSSVEYATAVCRAAGVRRLMLTHHDPDRDDGSIDDIVANIRSGLTAAGCAMQVCAAAEGQTVELEPKVRAPAAGPRAANPDATAITSAVTSHVVALGAMRPAAEKVIRNASEAEKLPLLPIGRVEDILGSGESVLPSLVILDSRTGMEQAYGISRLLREQSSSGAHRVPVLVIADEGDQLPDTSGLAADWLTWPFSEQYARSKIRACVLRAKCDWLRARLPENEALRLAELHRLGILDTKPEERFDRLTRIASKVFGVPIALVSLVDRDRQWFKSRIGIDAEESPRELAFCAHAILEDEPLIVSDALKDARFADNPVVTDEPHVRFYAGCPLKTVGNLPLGTLCLVDTRPRSFNKGQVDLLKDLAKLVEQEISGGKN